MTSTAVLEEGDLTHRSGYSLPQFCYVSEEQFQKDLKVLLEDQWHLVDHVSSIPNPGDYLLFDIANESVIVVRNQEDQIRAHHNVCRHRGSVICDKARGRVRLLTCPYHAWAYDLDGNLRNNRDMPEDFDRKKNGLIPCHVRIFHGLIFVCVSKCQPPNFEAYTNRFEAFLKPFDLENAKIACRKSFPTSANWKLCFENFIECYHCLPSHKTYSRVHDVSRQNQLGEEGEKLASQQLAWEEKAKELGTYVPPFQDDADSAFFQTGLRWEIGHGHVSGSNDGQPVAPLMGDFRETGYDGGHTYCLFGPLFTIGTYPDHVLLYRFVPRSARETDTEVIWLVRSDAEEGADYDLDRLIHLWTTTFSEDKKICEDNQKGVLSGAYQPGRYSLLETRTSQFADWYVKNFTTENESGCK